MIYGNPPTSQCRFLANLRLPLLDAHLPVRLTLFSCRCRMMRNVLRPYFLQLPSLMSGKGNELCCSRTALCCKLIDNLFHPEKEEVRKKRQGHCSIECDSYRVSCPFSSKRLKGCYVHDMSPYTKVCKDMQKAN